MLSLLAWIALSLFWFTSALKKLFSFQLFKEVVGKYTVSRAIGMPYQAHIVILLELCISLLFVFAETQKLGFILSIALFAFYAVAISVNILKGEVNFDCGCSFPIQSSNSKLSWKNVWLDLAMISIFSGIYWAISPTNIGVVIVPVYAFSVFAVLIYFSITKLKNNLSIYKTED